MKKLVYLTFCVSLLYACSQADTNIVAFDKKAFFLSTIASSDSLASVSEIDTIKLAKLSSKSKNAREAATQSYSEYGPFTVSASLYYHKSDRIVFSSNVGTFPAGTYDCDIYISVALVTLPANAIPIYVGEKIRGYTENGYYNQTEGVTRSEYESGNTKTYRMVTYSVIPIYTSSGQIVNPPTLPRDLTGNSYTYKYLIL